ncbi:ribonuclease H-like domain-containing protein [Mycena metata]|uniref:3'-5' exonuclease n=1 Tax=Mycena metata TaxID=1033252 RepID=A0AAD7DT74_9AGAR|nr:ribonuclease H-like domain-containing protein [Mycena metata]
MTERTSNGRERVGNDQEDDESTYMTVKLKTSRKGNTSVKPTIMSAQALPAYEQMSVFTVLTEKGQAETALSVIQQGPIGLDTEFCDPPAPVINADGTAQMADPWQLMKLCVVQIAIPGEVFILPVKIMKAFPDNLRRILESEAIAKAGVGLPLDGKVLFDAIGNGLVIRNMVDIGLMTKYSRVELYLDQDQSPLGLERCVQDILHRKLDKELQKSVWSGSLTEAQVKYAGLDAQASLEVFSAVEPRLQQKALSVPRGIPVNWYTFDCREGKPTRLATAYNGAYMPWSAKFCTWYMAGRFRGYHF